MIGKTILHYKILEKLGEGGMGEGQGYENDRLLKKGFKNNYGGHKNEVWNKI